MSTVKSTATKIVTTWELTEQDVEAIIKEYLGLEDNSNTEVTFMSSYSFFDGALVKQTIVEQGES